MLPEYSIGRLCAGVIIIQRALPSSSPIEAGSYLHNLAVLNVFTFLAEAILPHGPFEMLKWLKKKSQCLYFFLGKVN